MPKRQTRFSFLRQSLSVLCLLGLAGCYIRDIRWSPVRPPSRDKPKVYTLEVTGYCPCGSCCGWKRNWFFRPVIASGPAKGKPKAVGITASGARARPGTIAADRSLFPFGTIMYVPGYGYGRGPTILPATVRGSTTTTPSCWRVPSWPRTTP